MKRTILFLSLFVWSAIAQDAKLLTQKDVVQLLQLKTPEAEIITQVKASGTVFVLGQEDVARLKRAGASEALIAALQGGGTATGAQPDYEITDLGLVIDYSGSMNAKTKEGTTKMAAAKEAVGKLIDKLPADLNVAVVVYGASANYDSWGKEGGGQAVELNEKNPAPSPYTLRLRTEGDAAAQTTSAEAPKVIAVKAGNNYETAGMIPEAGMIVGDLKLDESAFYSTSVEKGDVLNVNLAAQKPWESGQSVVMNQVPEAVFKILIYDEDQVEAAKETFTIKNNPPDSKAGSLNWSVTLSGKAYIVVTVAKAGSNSEDAKKPPGPGRFALLVKKSGSSPAAAQPEASKTPEKKIDPFAGAETEGN